MNNRISLKILNTFSVSVFANQVVIVDSEYALLNRWKQAFDKNQPVLILGNGSNVLFLEDYIGIILLNRIRGIFISEAKNFWKLHVGAGEKWSKLIQYTLKKNIPGLENLAGIPGSVGAAPIQNIGAYGLEFDQVCEYVDVLELESGAKIRLTKAECQFQYRSSIFQDFVDRYAIIFVGLCLQKKWKPVLNHYTLKYLETRLPTPKQIYNIICLMRYTRIPHPIIFGNAGSFFKNPIITVEIACYLLKMYPTIPLYYRRDSNVKLSAGWLIDNCRLKGLVFGEAAVYCKHALVLINNRQIATGTEVAALALYIYNQVANKFNIYLQPEVRLISRTGEIHPKQLFKRNN